ncbi:nudix hydrolase 2-like isoform X2 [Macadamia integrifolia]|uniref:nudix hydrolase 2-like isoform X2 n=1 Tax=Macadamia integrifolia TaxID=60698 RepID=UPI001C4E760F|nr:nudix hydrolase 2-like isoform X2 [Macadamia integrifolia]
MLRFLSRPSSSSSFHLIKSRNANVTANQILCGSSFAINSSLDAIKGVKVRMMSPLINYVRARGISIPVRTPPLLMENVKTVQNNDAPPVQLLYGSNDGHGGVIVDLKDPMDSHLFVASLRASLSQWKRQGKKGIWIKIPIELANLVEAAVKVLVVQERIGKLQGIGLWKFPTGVINEGEDICVGAVREVKEETGIDTEFVEVLAFSESTKTFFEKSDLFFFCMLRPRSFEIQMQELEIEAAQWMPLEEYAAQPFIQEHILLKYGVNICFAKIVKGYGGFSGVPIRSSFSTKSSSLYLNSTYLNQSSLHSGKDF